SDILSPWVNPGDDVASRARLLIILLLLFFIASFVQRRIDSAEPSAPPPKAGGNDGPGNNPLNGWLEAVSAVTLVATTTLLVCWTAESGRDGQKFLPFWLVPIGMSASLLLYDWPTERKGRYNTFTKVVWPQLLASGAVDLAEVGRQIVEDNVTLLGDTSRQ